MTKFLVAMVVMAVAMLATACGDETTTIDGPVPVQMEGPVVNYDVPVCTSDADCGDLELCMLDSAATKSVGHTIMVCVIGCNAKMETVQNEDGTSVTDWVEGSDTCQRFGDTSLFCDLTSHECKEYSAEEPVVEPDTDVTPDTEPDVTPDVEPTGTKGEVLVSCCYPGKAADGSFAKLEGLFGAFGWSEATADNPDAWNGAWDRDLDFNSEWGCYDSMVNLDKVFGKFYSGLTTDKHNGDFEHDKAIQWVEMFFAKPSCTIDGKTAIVEEHFQGKGFPFYLAK